METLVRFRMMAIRVALVVIVIAGFATVPFDRLVARTILAGGVAGVVAFWIEAFRTENLWRFRPKKLTSFAYRWAFARVVLYGGVLFWAHTLDRGSSRALLGACAGLFVIRVVAIVLGITGVGLRQPLGKGRQRE